MVVFLLAVVGGPAMACFLPDAQMTQAERECCRHMAEQCGKMQMPSSHSCCETVVVPGPVSLVTAIHSLAVDLSVVPHFAVQPDAALASPADWSALVSSVHSPPESPPSTSQILRI